MSDDAARGSTLRPVSAGGAFWLSVAIGVWGFFDAARGGSIEGLRWGSAAATILWVLWVVLWRPSIRISDDAIDVVNALRTWTIPWSRVQDVESRLQYVIVLDDGRAVTAWGSPFSGRATGNRSSGGDLQLLVDHGATGGRATIVRSTAWWSLAIPAVAIGCFLVALVLATPDLGA